MISTDEPWAVNKVSHIGVTIEEFKETGETFILVPVSKRMRGASGTDIIGESDKGKEEIEWTLFRNGCLKRPKGLRFLMAESENINFDGRLCEQIAEPTVILAKYGPADSP